MRTTILLLVIAVSFSAQAQYRKDGRPDMRYKSNRQQYNYSTSTTRKSTTYSSSSSFSSPTIPSYPKKSNGGSDMRYKSNRQVNGLTTPSFANPSTSIQIHKNQNGTPDMRHKSNKRLYGY